MTVRLFITAGSVKIDSNVVCERCPDLEYGLFGRIDRAQVAAVIIILLVNIGKHKEHPIL